ncbi:laminin subunit alpha-like [Rhopilema esculentum]|uniref:laminin subunit alpha-like n=1 Tax=Rhopilema esculentum TaxID=499914 RepID=UPI0031E1728D
MTFTVKFCFAFQVFVDLYGGRSSTNSPQLQEWLNATHIRMRFSGLFKKFDIFSKNWHHYAVREIKVTGSCFCNGHASGCTINSTTGARSCQCRNNACGPLCDRCCPAFNQYPWKQGTGAPFEVDTRAACRPCNCHGHASSCVYNQTVANSRLSLNSTGFYSGGGVCQNCTRNTTGINCETCIPLFFRAVGKSRSAIDVCTECNCSVLGSRLVPGVQFLDCVRDETVNISALTAGDCYCKQNVHGKKCGVCRPEFYNLTQNNPLGCQDCLCHLPGTVNGSNVCDPGRTGNCPCKNNTEGRDCSSCKNEYFNLTANNLNGCQDCSCDPGGRASAICNKTSGQCSCKSTNFTGRQCDTPEGGFYFPNLHFIQASVSRVQSSNNLKGAVQIPRFSNGSGVFQIIIKYRSSVSASTSRATLNMPIGGTASQFGLFSILPTCTSTCYAHVNQNFTLAPATWDIFLNFGSLASSDISKIVIESVIILPNEFYTAAILGTARHVFRSSCDVIRNNMSRNGTLNPVCVKGVFSLTMGLLNEPIERKQACALQIQRESMNGVLRKNIPYGSQVFYCLFLHFTACNCSGDNKVCNQTTGQCVCPQNTVGRTCSQCRSNYWGWNSTTGCKACACNSTGSSNLQCDLNFGNCTCKPGVDGPKCSNCSDTFTGFSNSGCRLCNCSNSGSQNAVCNKVSGQCDCKANVMITRTCDRCDSQSFYLSSNHSYGCLRCVCMGITSNCSSSRNFVFQEPLVVYGWRMSNATTQLAASHSNSTIGNGGQSIPAMQSTITRHNEPVYWMAPNSFVRNSLVQSYGGYLEFTLTYSNAAGAARAPTQNAILKRGVVAIYQNISDTSPSLINVRRVRMHEDSWRYSNGSTLTRSAFVRLLAKPTVLLISASSYADSSNSYTSRIGGLSISTTRSIITSLGRALQVEQCQCGTGYSGSSCERCAPGYKRSGVASHAYLGTCRPCECNGHSTQCDPDTGRCLNCQHNTTGDFCQLCLPGFYGNATNGTSSDCRRCPCDAPKTTTQLCNLDVNGTVQCLNCSQGYKGKTCQSCSNGYYGQPSVPGGTCRTCQCTNNSDICNTTTGVCLNCQFNTSGNHCERCSDGWYGNAVLRTCQACSCNITGSNSSVCNHTNGQCPCKANVIGDKCTACQNNSYGFDSSGCKQCGCNAFGSVNLQCNDSGICECKNQTVGSKCDQCMLGNFGLPLQQCEACNCNTTGSRNESCSTSIGQCFCRNGVSGRQCATCQKQHINFTSTGCSACPQCSMLLQRKIDVQVANVLNTNVNLRTVQLLSTLTPALLAAEQRLNATQVSKAQFDNRMTVLQAGINRIKSDSLSRSVNNLVTRANQLATSGANLTSESSAELRRYQQIRNSSEQAATYVISVNSSVRTIVSGLQQIQANAEVLLSNVQGLSFNFTHQNELLLAQRNASQAQALLTRMQTSHSNASLQEVLVLAVNSNVSVLVSRQANQSRNLTDLQNQVAAQEIRLQHLSQIISSVQNTIRSTNATKGNISIDFEAIQNYTSRISGVLSQARDVLQSASETLNNASGLSVSLSTLTGLVNELQRNLSATRVTVNQATEHSTMLTREANNLTSAFLGARSHGANAVNAVRRYEEITRLINDSMKLSAQANRSVQEVLNYLRQPGSQNLTKRSTASLQRSQALHTVSLTQQKAISDVRGNLSQANVTYQAVRLTGSSVSYRFNLFLSLFNRLSVTAEYGNRPHSLERSITQANQLTNNITQSSLTTIAESAGLQANLSSMTSVVRELNGTVANVTQKMALASSVVANITRKLNSPVNAPINDVNNITRLMQQFNSTRPNLESRLSSIQSKLDALKQRLARAQAAIKLNGSNSVVYKPPSNALSRSVYSEVQMDFRTTQRNALLLHLGNTSALSTMDRMSLKIVDTKVVFEYSINGLLRRLTNWEVGVSDGLWRRVLATRQGDFSRLTVSVLSGNYSRTYSSYTGSDSTTMTYSTDSMIYLGALPPPDMVNVTAAGFNGCINNVQVNRAQVSLWNATSRTFRPGFCNATSGTSSSTGSVLPGASFAGNGFLQLGMGNFSIRNSSKVQFDFRTLHANGTLFAVTGAGNTILYEIRLVNGNLETFWSGARANARPSTTGSYADGNFYRVTVERTQTYFSVLVVSVATGTGPPISMTNGSQPLLEEGTVIYFGGVNVSVSGSTAYPFAGCIMNVRLSNNNRIDVTDSIQLNDPKLLRYSKGVNFNGCLPQIQNGVRFLGNGYASASTPSQRLSSLSIVCKTTEPDGVIFYSDYRGAKFYIALYHGNIFLDYKNASRNARNFLYTRSQTLNRGQYFTIDVIFTGNTLMALAVDGIRQEIQLASGLAPSVELNGRMYIGGIPTALSNGLSEFPVTQGFKGDFSLVRINGVDYLRQLITVSEFVSLAGVPVTQTVGPTPLPTTPPPTTSPPSCAAASGPPQFDGNVNLAGIGANTLLALRPPPAEESTVLSYFSVNYLVTIEFRAFSPFGVIFFVTNNNSASVRQFISLELVNGSLVYKFNSGGGLVHVQTTGNYALGQWTKVFLLRLGQFGAILVSPSQEYRNNRHENGLNRMQLAYPFYIGKFPAGVPTSMLTNPAGRNSFLGCIRLVQVESASARKLLNLQTNRDPVSRNVGRCYQTVVPMLRFTGTGYVIAERRLQTTSSFSVSVRFRTSQRYGILWHQTSTFGTASLMLQQRSGQLFLIHVTSTGSRSQLTWTDANIPSNRAANMSYYLCNNQPHTVTVARSSSNYTITVDSNPPVSGSIGNTNIDGPLYVGGSSTAGQQGLSGCLHSLVLNRRINDLAMAAASSDARSVGVGCSAT